MSEASFAFHEDVEARGLTLAPGQDAIADQLCDDASDIIRSRWPDVDARLSAGSLRIESVTRVVASMVKRAMERALPEGAQSGSETTGPFARSVTFVASASENLYLTGEDKRLFDANGAERRAFGVDMAQSPSIFDIPYCSPYWS